MTDQVKPVPRSWRRHLRFSVRRLIVLVLVIGAGLGWVVRARKSSAMQSRRLRSLKAVCRMIGSGSTELVFA